MSVIELAESMARGAGDLLVAHYGSLRRIDADRKRGLRRDLVSRADIEAEEYLIGRIPEADDVLAEEGHDRDLGAARKWVVDPLDGTVNFLHGLPFWCVSIGVVEAGVLTAGVVHAPALAQTFVAEAGKGCRLNGERVHVSATSELAEAILATGFSYQRNQVPDHNFDNFETLGMAAAGVRRMGAAALDLAYVACGRLDGFWELHLSAWDVAAGTLLIREAGGQVTDFAGSEDLDRVLFNCNIVAGNPELSAAIRARLHPLRGL